MQNYSSPTGVQFENQIAQPQDVIDDVVVSTVNPATSRLLDNCSALYSAMCAQALAGIDPYQVWENLTDQSQQYGFGQNVGVIGVIADTDIAAFIPTPSGVNKISLFTPAVAPTGQSSFAQDESAMTVIGTSVEANQTIWRSDDGGLTWSEVSYPSAPALSQEVLVAFDKYTGNWFIFRMNGGDYDTYRSGDDGLTWTLVNSLLPWNGTNRITFAAADGELFVNANLTTLNSTFRSTDNGATWSNAYAPASRYVLSVVESGGNVFALGHDSSDTSPYVAEWNGSSWTEITQTLPSSAIVSFTRFSTRVGPFIVALAIDTFGSASTTSAAWLFSRDGCRTWRTVPYVSANVQNNRYQSPSPGGIHVAVLNAATPMTLAKTELW